MANLVVKIFLFSVKTLSKPVAASFESYVSRWMDNILYRFRSDGSYVHAIYRFGKSIVTRTFSIMSSNRSPPPFAQ